MLPGIIRVNLFSCWHRETVNCFRLTGCFGFASGIFFYFCFGTSSSSSSSPSSSAGEVKGTQSCWKPVNVWHVPLLLPVAGDKLIFYRILGWETFWRTALDCVQTLHENVHTCWFGLLIPQMLEIEETLQWILQFGYQFHSSYSRFFLLMSAREGGLWYEKVMWSLNCNMHSRSKNHSKSNRMFRKITTFCRFSLIDYQDLLDKMDNNKTNTKYQFKFMVHKVQTKQKGRPPARRFWEGVWSEYNIWTLPRIDGEIDHRQPGTTPPFVTVHTEDSSTLSSLRSVYPLYPLCGGEFEIERTDKFIITSNSIRTQFIFNLL